MSVQKRTDNGRVRWVGRYYGPDGRQRSKSFTTRREASAWAGERAREIRRGEWLDPRDAGVTLSALWSTWEAAATNPRTRTVRARVGRNLGEYGDYPATAVRAVHMRAWLAHLRDGRPWGGKALSDNTVRAWWGQMRGCWSLAVDDHIILRSPCEGVSPALGARPVDPTSLPSAGQIQALAEAATASRREVLAVMIELAATTGLRPGEVAGLRVRSLDLLRRELHVVEQSTPGDSSDSWTALKTGSAARRTVPLTSATAELLAAHLAAHPAGRDEPVFRSRTGLMWHSGLIAAAMKALSGGTVTFQKLRHFYASALIREGLGVKAVQTLLGHASAETTLSSYVHLWPDEGDRARTAIGSAWDKGRTRAAGEAGGAAQ